MVALKLQVWYIPKFYSFKFQYHSSIWECKDLILSIDLMVKSKFKIAGLLLNLGFWGSIYTLQCARVQTMMLSIQCFSLDSCFEIPSWADLEDCHLESRLIYKVLWYLFWKLQSISVWISKLKFHSISLISATSYSN